MEIHTNKAGYWSRKSSLFDALELRDRITAKSARPYVISLTGAGGKTSYIRRLAAEGVAGGLKVLVATTTHMQAPARLGVFIKDYKAVRTMLMRESAAVVGEPAPEGKIKYVGDDFYREICPMADLVLAEADGSRRLPLKAPGPGEPVIPGNCNMILCLAGLSALGRQAEETCFRLQRASELMDARGERSYKEHGIWTIEPPDIRCLMRYGYLEPLHSAYPGMTVIPVFHQADSDEDVNTAKRIAEEMKAEWALVSGMLRGDESSALF